MDELIVILLATIITIGAIGGAICGIANYMGSYTCNNYQEMTGKETKWKTMDECYIKTESGWQRYDEYIKRAVASEGLSK